MAEPSGLPTEEQEKSMKEMRSCQRKAGWHGLWATLIGGAVSYGGMMALPRQLVPKMYIPMISLGCASCCGWMVAVSVTKTCRLNQLQSLHTSNLSSNPISDGKRTLQYHQRNDQQRNDPLRVSNKFGDEAFYKEEK